MNPSRINQSINQVSVSIAEKQTPITNTSVCYLVRGGLASGRRTSDNDSKSDVESVVQLQNLVDVQRHCLQTLLSQFVTNRSVKAHKQTIGAKH